MQTWKLSKKNFNSYAFSARASVIGIKLVFGDENI